MDIKKQYAFLEETIIPRSEQIRRYKCINYFDISYCQYYLYLLNSCELKLLALLCRKKKKTDHWQKASLTIHTIHALMDFILSYNIIIIICSISQYQEQREI